MKWSWLSFFSQSCEKWMSGFRFFSARVSVVGNGWTVWCFNTTKSNTKTCAWVSSCFWSLFCLVYIKKNRSHPETRANSHVSLKSHLISTRKHRVNIWSILSCNHGVNRRCLWLEIKARRSELWLWFYRVVCLLTRKNVVKPRETSLRMVGTRQNFENGIFY